MTRESRIKLTEFLVVYKGEGAPTFGAPLRQFQPQQFTGVFEDGFVGSAGALSLVAKEIAGCRTLAVAFDGSPVKFT